MNPQKNDESASEGPVSRRRLLSQLGLAAAGGGALAVTGAVGGEPAVAANGDSLLLGQANSADYKTTLFPDQLGFDIWSLSRNGVGIRSEMGALGLWGRTGQKSDGVTAGVYGDVYYDTLPGTGVMGVGPNNHAGGIGVEGIGYKGIGVHGTVADSGYGVLGHAGIGYGVRGEVTNVDGIGVSGEGPGVAVKGKATTAGGTGVQGAAVDGGTAIRGEVPNYGYGVRAKAGAGFGLLAEVVNGVAVAGDSTDNGWGVKGTAANGGWGVQGISDTSFGVRGDSTGGTGVRGNSTTDVGVYGRSTNLTGVLGYGGSYGVIGQCDAGGTAIDGASSDGGTGVWGRSLPTGYGVRGESSSGFGVRGDAVTGIAVSGNAPQGTAVSGVGKLGGEFRGTRAAMRLVPTAYVGSPPTGRHLKGDLVCDKNGDLWFCKADGTPGTWVKIA